MIDLNNYESIQYLFEILIKRLNDIVALKGLEKMFFFSFCVFMINRM